ncbi:hypothetical protein ACNOYE_09305 [Nannocystaceae bacterium ST9]
MDWRLRFTMAGWLAASGCHEPEVAVAPEDRAKPEPAPLLSEADEALLAALSSDDPGDFFDDRARLWRVGAIHWQEGQAEIAGRPAGADTLPQPLQLVVVDPIGPRVLLPLDQLEWRPPGPELVRVSADQDEAPSPEPLWRALRLTALVGPGDLVAGLRRDLAPTPWLELDAGIPLTPLDREGERLRVGWDDRECGFGLTLTIDPAEFGPLHRPGPEPSAEAQPPTAGKPTSLRLDPATAIHASAEDREPLLRLHPASSIDPEGPGWIGQTITREGPAKRGRTPIVLRCHGVTVRGWVETKALRESPGRYAFVEPSEPPSLSSCESNDGASTMSVPPGTALFADVTADDATLVGVVVEEVDMPVRVEGGWMATCVPSPWGDLEVRFRSR